MSFRATTLLSRPSSAKRLLLATPFATAACHGGVLPAASGLSTASASFVNRTQFQPSLLRVPQHRLRATWGRSASSLAYPLPSNSALTALREQILERVKHVGANGSSNDSSRKVPLEQQETWLEKLLTPARLRTLLLYLAATGVSLWLDSQLGGKEGGGVGGSWGDGNEEEDAEGAGGAPLKGRGWSMATWTQGISGQLPLVIEMLLASNLLVFALGLIPGNAAWMKANLAVSPYNVITRGRLHTLLTSAFVHLGPLHLFLNCYGLVLFGAPLVKQLGDLPFLGTLGVTAVASGLIGTYLQGFVGPQHFRQAAWFTPGIGMSGALMAFFAMRAFSHPEDRYKIALIPMPYMGARELLACFATLDFCGLLLPFIGRSSTIHHGAHLGGYAAGIIAWQMLTRLGYM